MTEDKKTEEKEQAAASPAEENATQAQMPVEEELLVSSSPHLHDQQSIRKIMLMVIIALLPACLVGIYIFGIDALKVIIYCTVFCVAVEMLWRYVVGSKTDSWKDCSAIVTGIILAMNLSPGVPWWLCLIGAVLGIGLGKQIFGGIGYNPFNPAIVARVGLLIGLPKYMTTWVPTRFMSYGDYGQAFSFAFDKQKISETAIKTYEAAQGARPFFKSVCDGVTCATPLGVVTTTEEVAKTASGADSVFAGITTNGLYWDYFWGNVGGCLGETSVIALLIGGVFLIAMKIIKWQIPVSFIGSVIIFTAIVHGLSPSMTPDFLFHILTGGLMLGAFFIATDMVTSPMTKTGMLIFGAGCGIVTCLIRIWGNYPEGVSFSILFMNAFVPLIDRFCRKKPFGFKPVEKGAAK
jgi:electron transport complex protein RnfD